MPRTDVIKCSTEAGNINCEPISTFSQTVTFPASGQLSLRPSGVAKLSTNIILLRVKVKVGMSALPGGR